MENAEHNIEVIKEAILLTSQKKDRIIGAVLAMIGGPIGLIYSNLKIGSVFFYALAIDVIYFSSLYSLETPTNFFGLLDSAFFMISFLLIYLSGFIISVISVERHNKKIERKLQVCYSQMHSDSQ